MPPLKKVNLAEKLTLFTEHWSPKIVGQLNGQHLKLAKFQGEFVWHKHDETDEMFFVVQGRFTMQLRDGDVDLEAGEFIIIPAGVEHCPRADEEVHVLLIEQVGTLNTGDAEQSDKTADVLDTI